MVTNLKWDEVLNRWKHNPKCVLGCRKSDYKPLVLTVGSYAGHSEDGFHIYAEWYDGSLARRTDDMDINRMASLVIKEPLEPIDRYDPESYSIPDGLHTKDLQELSDKLVAVNEWMHKAYEAIERLRELPLASQKLKDSFEDAMASKLDTVLSLAWAECDKILVGRFSHKLAEKRRGKDSYKRRQELYEIIHQAEQELEG